MVLAGEDTTANTLAWMTHYMSELPDVQNAMHAEAGAVVNETGMLATLEDAERLPYIEAVTHETMRLKPVAPVLFLETIEEAEIAGVSLPKGTALMTLMMHGGLQDANFGHAAEFNPKRWLEATDAPATGCPHNTRAFVPFGGGPRVCPGRHLALVEIKVAMSMICAAFEIAKPANTSEPGELFSFSMMPQNLRVRFKARSQSPRTPAERV
jgi:cytochrome P450